MRPKKNNEGGEQKTLKKASMASLRLQKDLKAFQERQLDFVELEFPQPGNLQEIVLVINLNLTKEQLEDGDTPYNHIKLKFSLSFPDSYPIQPPKMKCLNKIYHPNFSYTGSVCLPLIREDWSPTVSLETIIYGIIFILQFPNADDALEPQIGDQMKSDYKMFEKIVAHTMEGRVFKQKQYDKIKL